MGSWSSGVGKSTRRNASGRQKPNLGRQNNARASRQPPRGSSPKDIRNGRRQVRSRKTWQRKNSPDTRKIAQTNAPALPAPNVTESSAPKAPVSTAETPSGVPADAPGASMTVSVAKNV